MDASITLEDTDDGMVNFQVCYMGGSGFTPSSDAHQQAYLLTRIMDRVAERRSSPSYSYAVSDADIDTAYDRLRADEVARASAPKAERHLSLVADRTLSTNHDRADRPLSEGAA